MRSARNKWCHGFTLIETILTLLIIGIGLFGIMTLFQNMSFQMYHADLQVIAADFAQQKVEQLVAQKAFNGYNTIVSQPNEAVTSGPHTFTRTTLVEFINPSTMALSVVDTGYKRITIQVSWAGNAGVTLVTLVTNQVPL